MYKKKLQGLRVGQLVQLKVVESNNSIIIVSFEGKLLRVSNKTQVKFNENKLIQLIVKKVNPVEFSLPAKNGFDVWV